MKREHIKQTAITMACETGLENLSRRDLCKRAGIADGSFLHVMGHSFTDLVQELRDEGHGVGAHPITKKRASPEARKAQILQSAVDMACEVGYNNITRAGVAERAGVAMGSVSRYFSTMNNLRRAVMGYAIANQIPELVAQGLGSNDPRALKAPPELIEQALATYR